tara:strand:- start:27608 stop:28213 length:606 start_codon:yes stop_codon:yes gene_type:complete
MPIKRWIICISGFMQTRSTYGGIPALWHELHTNYTQPGVVVYPAPWASDWAHLAEWIERRSDPDQHPRIDVFAYSWGVGFGLVNLAKYLKRRGMHIDNAVTSDGVACVGPKYVRAVLAYCPEGRLDVGDNIRRVVSYRQKNEPIRLERHGLRLKLFGLRGHKVYKGSEPQEEHIDNMGRYHSSMDESPEFLEMCRTISEEG